MSSNHDRHTAGPGGVPARGGTGVRPPPPPPPGARVIRLTEIDQAAAFFAAWQGRLEQLSRGRFEGSLRVVHTGTVRLVAADANQRLRLSGRDAAGLCSVHLVTPENAAALWHGRRLEPGQFVVHGPEAETDHCTARRLESLALTVRADVLEEAGRSLLHTDGWAVPRTWAARRPPPAAFDDLTRRLTVLLSAAVADPSLLGTPEGRRLEQECLRSMAACFASAPEPLPALPVRAGMTRRAEDFFQARLGDAVGAVDVCRELGVSDRTLRLAFRERFGVGPMAYYKCLRLNAVRAELKADPAAVIARVAREYGFHHLGNFAADYRRQFGEPPSAVKRPGA
ncbi:MAG: helix-turn-helix domain-containing protein [Gemmataceae bacterium]